MKNQAQKMGPEAATLARSKGRRSRAVRALAVAFVLVTALIPLLNCSPAVLVNVWRDPEIQAPKMNNLLVIAVRTERLRRRMWEDAFALELADYGVNVTRSYRLYPDEAPDTSQIRTALSSHDFSGVLVTYPLPALNEEYYIPGYFEPEPGYGFDPYWGRYYHYWYWSHRPGYYETVTTKRQQIDVYQAEGNGGRLIWSGTTEVKEPGTGEELRQAIVTRVVPSLSRQGIIPARK